MVKEDKKIKIGIIGLGHHTKDNILPALLISGKFKINGLCSSNINKAKEAANKYNIPFYTKSWQELITQKDIEAILIIGTPELHFEIIKEAISLELHVFVEKPPAPNFEKLENLLAIKHKHPKIKIFVGFNFRFCTNINKLNSHVKANGEIRFMNIKFICPYPFEPRWEYKTTEESYLMCVGIHPIDTSIKEFGKVINVRSTHIKLYGDIFILKVILEFKNGQQALLELGNYSNRFNFCYEVINENGFVGKIQDNQKAETYQVIKHDFEDDFFNGSETHEYIFSGFEGGYNANGYQKELENWAENIQRDLPSSSDLTECKEVFSVINLILQQIQTV